MTTIPNPAVPKGSTVLVTGANGFLGSHVADQFLRHGYKVRATVRDASKDAWAADVFGKLYGKDNFELVAVPEMATEGAYDEVIKGVSVVAHTAAYMQVGNDANEVIPITIAGAVNALKAAYAEPSVKRFVLTSSSSAAVGSLDRGVTVTEDRYNEKAIGEAWKGPPYEPTKPMIVYEASKVESEQAVWKFHKENRSRRPDLVVNTVLPNMVFGRVIDPVNQGHRSSNSMVAQLWNGERNAFHEVIARQYYVDAEDMGRLHVAGALFPHVQDQRIFAFAGHFSWDKVLDIMRGLDPQRELPEHFSGGEDPNVIVPAPKAEALLRELGRSGWTSLADAIAASVKDA